jgi:enoyl-CoA hydratase
VSYYTLSEVLAHSATLSATLDDGILWVRIGRDDDAGAMVRDAFSELGNLFDVISVSDEIRVVVLQGAGKQFSTGGNVRKMAERAQGADEVDRFSLASSVNYLKRMYRNLLSVDQPVIACVNGHAVGAGTTLALHCDIVLASEEAKFGDPHVKRGLVASAGPGIWSLMTSLNLAKEYLLTGDLLSAQEAHRMGLVNHVYAPAELEEATRALATRLAEGAPLAIQWTKRLLNRSTNRQMIDLLQDGIAHELLTFDTRDHVEGVQSFLEHRAPVFKGV